jgi:hypothetical protein
VLISKLRTVLGAAILIVATAAVTAIIMTKWDNLFPPTDYEDCAVHAAKDAKSKDSLSVLLSLCDAEFKGRRKPGGGYAYYNNCSGPRSSDLGRTFDIKGPNPTPDEQKHMTDQCWADVNEDQRTADQEAEAARKAAADAEEIRQAQERRRAAIAQASFENQQRQANLELQRKQQALADLERRRLAAVSKVEVLTTSIDCVLSFSCQFFKLSVKIRNNSSETISAVSFGWAFTSQDTTCPSAVPTKTQERINLRPGDTAVLNLDGHDDSSNREFHYCVKVSDAQLALVQ